MQPNDPYNPQNPPVTPQPGVVPPAPMPGEPAPGPLAPGTFGPTVAPSATTPNPTAPQQPQPQFQGQPQFQPQQQPPMGVQPGSQPSFGSLPSMDSSGKGGPIIKIVIAAFVAILLALGGYFLFSNFSSVSIEDYSQASTLSDEVVDAYNDMDVYISQSSTETELKNDLDTIKKNREAFNTKFDELGGMKAVKRDKEVKDLYKALDDKKVNFDEAADAMLEAYEKIFPVMIKMDSTTSSSGTTAISRMRKEFEAVSGLENKNNQDMVTNVVAALKKMEGLAPKVEAGRKDYTKYDSKTVQDFYDAGVEMTDAIRDWQSNMQKLAEDAEIRDELNALSQKLFEKKLPKQK